MSLIELSEDAVANPVDLIEHVAALNDWAFERAGDDEITISVAGSWCDYHVSYSWLEEREAMHLACGFDLKVPEARRLETMRLIAIANEQMWMGHFDIWPDEGIVVYRHAMPLPGGAEPTTPQIEKMLNTGVEACERYFQAFQFVVWAGKPAREALDSVLFETAGEA